MRQSARPNRSTHVLRPQKGHRPPLHRRNPPRLPALSAFVRNQPPAAIDLLDLTGRVIPLPLNDIKHICYVRDFNLNDTVNPERLTRRTFLARPRTEGLWLRLTFRSRQTSSKASPPSTSPSSTTSSTTPASSSPRPTPAPTPSASTSPAPPSPTPAPRRHHHPLPPQTPPSRLRPLHAGRPLRQPHPPNTRPN